MRSLIDFLFPPYNIIPYYAAGQEAWGISKRHFLFLYLPLKHTKTVKYDSGTIGSSHEILTFETAEEAEDEIDRLMMGYVPLKEIVWKNNKIIKKIY